MRGGKHIIRKNGSVIFGWRLDRPDQIERLEEIGFEKIGAEMA
jgi:hypothetical protein